MCNVLLGGLDKQDWSVANMLDRQGVDIGTMFLNVTDGTMDV